MLPFVTPPAPRTKRRIGNEQVGILEVEVRGGLTVGESATIAELLANEQSAFVRGAQIADGIASEEGISLAEAFAIVEKAISGQPLEEAADAIRLRHAARIDEIAKVYSLAGQLNMEASVTAVIRSRLAPEWALEDTRAMDRPLFDGIWKLVQEETAAEATPVEPPSAEDLGKPQPERGRGRKPTGDA